MTAAVEKRPALAQGELVKAYSIANFNGTDFEKDFLLNGDVTQWIGGGKNNKKMPSMDSLSPLEQHIFHNALRFKFSKHAAEHYVTEDIVNNLSPDAYVSANLMLMNGSQFPHYHPADLKYPENSLRAALVFPAANSDSSKKQGLSFRAFNINNAEVSQKIPEVLGQEIIPEIKGDPVSPEHVVDLEPGHVSLLIFRGNSVHSFEGEGVIKSFHVLDVDARKIGNTYDGNTLRWLLDTNLSSQKLVGMTSKGTENPHYNSLQELMYGADAIIDAFLRKTLASHDLENPLTANQAQTIRHQLRSLATREHWEARSESGIIMPHARVG
jgi:hypothetical protein